MSSHTGRKRNGMSCLLLDGAALSHFSFTFSKTVHFRETEAGKSVKSVKPPVLTSGHRGVVPRSFDHPETSQILLRVCTL